MRTLKSLSLMMLLTLTCVTTEASTATETAYTTQVKNKKHAKKEPNKKVKSHKKITTNRPSGVVVHYNHKPYLYSHGYYYCQQNGRYVKVRPSIRMPGAESFNAKVKAFRSQFRGVTDIPFFLFRLAKLCALYGNGRDERNRVFGLIQNCRDTGSLSRKTAS